MLFFNATFSDTAGYAGLRTLFCFAVMGQSPVSLEICQPGTQPTSTGKEVKYIFRPDSEPEEEGAGESNAAITRLSRALLC